MIHLVTTFLDRDNAINCSTGVTVDDMDSDGSYTPMVEERRPQHTEIMLENFYKELLAAAHQLQRAQPGKVNVVSAVLSVYE